jgi:uncharacterized protein YjbI with pentapeptide repeats
MKYLMTLLALVVAVTAGAQVMDTIVVGNEIHFNVNYAKVDSMLDSNADLQAQVDSLEALPTSYADLSNANLAGAGLGNANLSSANLSSADLAYANLSSADLTNANLTFANLSSADLTNANLIGADLTGAFFAGANLSGVNWTGAYILGCMGCDCSDENNDNYCD